jgi:5-methylcytosine-specific restriction enzyme subunit McrC
MIANDWVDRRGPRRRPVHRVPGCTDRHPGAVTAHELTEYQTRRIDWPDPSSSDRQLADLLEDAGRRLRIRWLDTGHAEITTYSWIGVVQFDRYRLHIVPKAAGGNLGVLQMLDYSSGIAALREVSAQRDLATGGTHLRDLVCRLQTLGGDTILRQGPARHYVTREAALPAVRGRLLADRQVLYRFGQLDQLECRYDEYESDTLDNEILAAGLDLAARTATSSLIRAHARRVAADFAAICDPSELDPRSAAEQLA